MKIRPAEHEIPLMNTCRNTTETSSTEHDIPAPMPAADANFVIDIATSRLQNQNKSSTAVKADFKIETQIANT